MLSLLGKVDQIGPLMSLVPLPNHLAKAHTSGLQEVQVLQETVTGGSF